MSPQVAGPASAGLSGCRSQYAPAAGALQEALCHTPASRTLVVAQEEHMRWLLGAVLALSIPGAAAAQSDDPHAACSAVGWVPREVLERPLPLRTGIGRT